MKAIIEMPKGDKRRRHLNFEKTEIIDPGLIEDMIPINGGIMPVNYGYISETLNEKEGDEIDVLVLSKNVFKIGQEIEIHPIALILREDEDDKIVAVDFTMDTKDWESVHEDERRLIETCSGRFVFELVSAN